jgi:thiamine-phosphate pyrophosphorylase
MANNILPCRTYLITDGSAAPETFPVILNLIERAVGRGISMVQLREKQLTARQLFELARQAVSITRGSGTKLLVNDRADVAFAADADGVHLTSRSLPASAIRGNFPAGFIIGVSAHSLETAQAAKSGGANFITFSPIFPTGSKINYGEPQGVEKLGEVVEKLEGFPVFALGGLNETNYREALEAGAAGVAGISWFYEILM